MKETLKTLALIFVLVLASCEKNSTESAALSPQLESGIEDLDFLEAFAEPGDVITIAPSLDEEAGYVILSIKTEEDQNSSSSLLAKHAYSTSNKIKFGKWCNDQLKNGDCLEVGYTDGVYWANIIPCP